MNQKQGRDEDDPLRYVWREYEFTRNGIAAYDEHLFRIRSWYIALTAILVSAYFGVNVQIVDRLDPNLALFAVLWLSCVFWLLDALNKSLQNVHIHNSLCLEAIIRNDPPATVDSLATSFVPTISLRFAKKEKRHLRPTVKNLTDESLWPFYILPMLIAGIVIVGSSDREWCSAFTKIVHGCTASWNEIGFASVAVAAPVLLLTFSRMWRSERPRFKYAPFLGRKYRKAKFVERIKKGLYALKGVRIDAKPEHLTLFKTNFRAGACWIIVDGLDRARNEKYRAIRRTYFAKRGEPLLVVNVLGEITERPDREHANVIACIEEAAIHAPYRHVGRSRP